VLKYKDVTKICDDYHLTRLVLSKYFKKKGITVCYLPLTSEGITTGAHIHMSLWKDGVNLNGDINEPTKISPLF